MVEVLPCLNGGGCLKSFGDEGFLGCLTRDA